MSVYSKGRPVTVVRVLSGLLAVVGVVAVAGCGGGDPSPTSLGEKGAEVTSGPTQSEEPDGEESSAPVGESAEYKAALADGQVTEEEYLAGFKRYASCLSAAGYELNDPHMDGKLMTFLVPGAAVSSGVDDACYKSEFELLDAQWQGQNTTDFSEEIEYLADCLEKFGTDPGDVDGASDEDTMDRLQALYDKAGLFGKCLE